MVKNKKKSQKKVGEKLTDNVDEDKLSIVSEGYIEYAAFFCGGDTFNRVYALRPYTVSKIRSRPYLSKKKCETVLRDILVV